MSAVPLQSMHAHHARHIRRAFNKRHDAAVGVGSLQRSHSSDARLEDREHLHHHHRPVHALPAAHHVHAHREHQSASVSPSPAAHSTTKSEPASCRSHSPPAVQWTCAATIGQRLVEFASQGFGGSVRS